MGASRTSEPSDDVEQRPRIVIAGAGIAALEALVGLRALLDGLVDIDIVAPVDEFVYRPASVAEPFAVAGSPRLSLARIAGDQGANLHRARVESVDHDHRRVGLFGGGSLPYDVLLLAIGARQSEWLPGATLFTGPDDVQRLRTLLSELEGGEVGRIVFTAPRMLRWTLPLYELTLLTAARVGELRLGEIQLTIVTPEPRPLEVLGVLATRHVRELCANHGIALKSGVSAVSFERGQLTLEPDGHLQADRVVALPELRGQPIAGVPCDQAGFIPVDEHGAVRGLAGVYAAGDGTDYAIKQGGLAAQQADAVAESIAASLGVEIQPRAFDGVLRGQLLTGLTPAYMTVGPSLAGRQESQLAFDPLWRPAGKFTGRFLPAYLSRLTRVI
jgi:sulfide:quinone oxidoreductase